MLTRLITLSLALLIALAIPAGAAASGNEAIRDCAEDGDLDNQYSDEELEDASANMPSDVDAYSSCREVFRQAQAGGRGGSGEPGDSGTTGGTGGSGGGGGNDGGANRGDVSGTDGATPSDMEELNRLQEGANNGTAPGESASLTAGADAGGDDGLPTAALVAIALLGLAAVGGGVYILRDYLPPGLSSRLPGASR